MYLIVNYLSELGEAEPGFKIIISLKQIIRIPTRSP